MTDVIRANFPYEDCCFPADNPKGFKSLETLVEEFKQWLGKSGYTECPKIFAKYRVVLYSEGDTGDGLVMHAKLLYPKSHKLNDLKRDKFPQYFQLFTCASDEYRGIKCTPENSRIFYVR